MRADQGDQLQLDVHMSRAQSTDEGRDKRGSVRELWLQRLCFKRLNNCRTLHQDHDISHYTGVGKKSGRRFGG